MGLDALVFWMFSFKPAFSLFSFTFIKGLFSYFSLSFIRVVSSAYLGLLIFLLEILIPACDSSSPSFHLTYSTYRFPDGSVVANPPVNAGHIYLIPGVGEIPWNKKWQPTPVFLPGKFHGERNLVGYSPWGCKESDTTERLTQTHSSNYNSKLLSKQKPGNHRT